MLNAAGKYKIGDSVWFAHGVLFSGTIISDVEYGCYDITSVTSLGDVITHKNIPEYKIWVDKKDSLMYAKSMTDYWTCVLCDIAKGE